MKAIKNALIIASLLTSASCLADEPKQPPAAIKTSALDQLVVQAEIDVEKSLEKLQHQLKESIRQQASVAISSLAESIKTLIQ